MNFGIRPILSVLIRSPVGPLLVAIEMAIALAVGVNAAYIVHQRIEKVARPTGIDDANQFVVYSVSFIDGFNYDDSVQEDLAYLRGLPGIVAVSVTNAAPFSQDGNITSVWTKPDHKGPEQYVNYFEMDEHAIQALGTRLLAGRAFHREEILPPVTERNANDFVPEIIITESLAKALFPHRKALGATVYDALNNPVTIVGITHDMIGSAFSRYPGDETFVALAPRMPLLYGFAYLVRTKPGRRDALMRIVEQHLSASNLGRTIRLRSVEFFKNKLYLTDRVMQVFLVAVDVLLFAITSVGIFALSMFNVSSRTRQIGVRRALGARRKDIFLYFMIEIALITSVGVVFGCMLAIELSYWLSAHYGLPRLDLHYLVTGVLALWILGQFAVYAPAREATTVPPSVATRTV